MRNRITPVIAATVAVALVTIPGCGPQTFWGVSSGGPSWTIAAEDPIPGIHEGTAEVITLKFGSPGGVTIVVWCDRSSGSSFHGSADRNGAFSEGHFRLPDDAQVDFRCETENGSLAKVTIDDRSYDSSKGSLFLISTQSREIQIKQMDADVQNFPRKAVAIKNYAINNPDISSFFTDARNNASVKDEQ